MQIVSIFENDDKSKLWAVCYPEDNDDDESIDIFSKLFEQWQDTAFLRDFFKENEEQLKDPFWDGMSIDAAIDYVLEEAGAFEELLWNIATNQPGFENHSLTDVFKPLHKNIYSLTTARERYRKGKPNLADPMLRLYAIELDDGTMIITGGGIKLTRTMENDLGEEKKQLDRVKDYLRSEGICDILGLITS